MKASRSIPLAHKLPHDATVSATPTAFALRIGQFPAEEDWQKSLLSSAQALDSRPPTLLCGRAGNACTNLLGSFVCYVRTRGIDEAVESGKTADFRSVLCRTHSPRMARATNSCTPRWFGRRTARVLLTDFCALFVSEKREKKKSFFILKITPHPSACG